MKTRWLLLDVVAGSMDWNVQELVSGALDCMYHMLAITYHINQSICLT
jgi:hypothetical protein